MGRSFPEVDGRDGEGERPASIQLLELSRPVIVFVELLHHFRRNLVWRFLSVNPPQSCLGVVEHVYSLYHLARWVFLEEEYKKLVLTRLDYVDEPLSFLAVQLSWKNDVSDCVYHLFLVWLTREWVFAIFRLYLHFVFVCTLLTLCLYRENCGVLALSITFSTVVIRNHTFWSAKWT